MCSRTVGESLAPDLYWGMYIFLPQLNYAGNTLKMTILPLFFKGYDVSGTDRVSCAFFLDNA